MRNLILFAIALKVVLTEEDVQELGYDVTLEDFKTYFSIPEDAEVNEKDFTSNFEKVADFKVGDLAYFFNANEKKIAAKLEAPKNEPKKSTDPLESATKAQEAKAKKEAEKEEAKAKKEAEKAAKEEAKAKAKKEKEEAKAKARAEKEAAKKPKELSRSRLIEVYYGAGASKKQIEALHPDFKKSHIDMAFYHASGHPERVVESTKMFNDLGMVLPTFPTIEEKPKVEKNPKSTEKVEGVEETESIEEVEETESTEETSAE